MKLYAKLIVNTTKIKVEASPFPHVFPLPPFPLCTSLREPTASASRGATLGSRIDRGISFLMPLRFVRQLRTQTAQSLVLSVKLGVRFLAALRLAFRLRKCVFCFNQKDEATVPRLFD